jgi:NAD(P)-dependent dehydrogenase (short-subunit alcohol dehydrogenase family)
VTHQEDTDVNRYDLQDQVAVITGGAQGIGRAVAERMIASGAQVALWDMDHALVEKTAQALGDSAYAYGIDVRDLSGVVKQAARVAKDLGQIDILVASAGIAGPNAPVVDYDPKAWADVIDINLTGVFNCCKSVLPYMVERGYGRVVNIASVAGKEGNPNAGPYAASKAGVIGLTKTLGKEHANQDIAVNCVTPATANTRILDQLTPEFIDYMLSKIPRGRFLEVEEAASMITWLCTKDNSFTTASVFDLSGGRATY